MMEVKCPYCEFLFNSPASANAKIADEFNILLIACPHCEKFLGAVADPVQPHHTGSDRTPKKRAVG